MRMKALAAATVLLAAASGTARAHHQEIVLQLRGPLQAEFAGYYVADYQGFYDEGDVAVRIEPGGPGVSPAKVLADGGANIAVEWLPEALAARARGVPLVNIAQIFKRSGLGLTCRKDAGIATPADLAGKRLGVWPDGNPYPLRAWMKALGLATDGTPAGVTVVDQGPGVGLLVDRTADCITTMRYDQYGQLLDAGLKPDELVVFDYQDQGVATLEDGLYVLASVLKDPDHVATLGGLPAPDHARLALGARQPGRGGAHRAGIRYRPSADRAAAGADDGGDQQARRRHHGRARPGRLPAHAARPGRRRRRPEAEQAGQGCHQPRRGRRGEPRQALLSGTGP